MIVRCAIVLGFVCGLAIARTPDGSLGALRLPNNCRPAVVHAGASFDVEAQQRGELRIKNESAEFPLAPTWEDIPSGGVRAVVTISDGVPAGAYTLEWSLGDEADRNVRALYVVDVSPENDPFSLGYSFACVAARGDIGDNATAGSPTAKFADAINSAQAQFAVVFLRGPEGRYRETLAELDQCAIPTWVVPDAPESVCNAWFGPNTFSFRYGPDAFLSPASGRNGLEDALGPATSHIARVLRSHESARWKVGLFSRPGSEMSMRNEISLFVDDTLHACIFGITEGQAVLPNPLGWAGWFDPPRVYTIAKDRVIVFTANRKSIAPEKPVGP